MDPKSLVEKIPRAKFDDLIENEAIFEEVSSLIYNLHVERNQKVNEQNPLSVKMETTCP